MGGGALPLPLPLPFPVNLVLLLEVTRRDLQVQPVWDKRSQSHTVKQICQEGFGVYN